MAVAPASFGWRLKCSLYQDCYQTSYNGSANCFSSGNACMVSGSCIGIGQDPNCTTNCPKIPKVQQESSLRPLNMDYKLAGVTIERPNAAAKSLASMPAAGTIGRN